VNAASAAGAALAAGGWTLAAVLAVGALASAAGAAPHPVVIAVQAAAPRLIPLGALLGAALLLLHPVVGVGLPGGALLSAAAAWTLLLLPVAPVDAPAGTAGRDGLLLLSSNLLLSNDEHAAAGADIAAAGADVVVTLETAEDAVDALARNLPGYRLTGTGTGERGRWTAIWVHERALDHVVDADRPLTAGDETYPGIAYRAGGADSPVIHVVGIHLHAPGTRDNARHWRRELADLTRAAEAARRRGEHLVLAGDFNAGRSHPAMGRLLAVMRDAGRTPFGWGTPTWPVRGAGPRPYRTLPPILDLDHILTGPGVDAGEHRTVRVTGSDHLAVTARITPRR